MGEESVMASLVSHGVTISHLHVPFWRGCRTATGDESVMASLVSHGVAISHLHVPLWRGCHTATEEEIESFKTVHEGNW
jgi:hypothetical protein